jgi:hypothetical protein
LGAVSQQGQHRIARRIPAVLGVQDMIKTPIVNWI